MNSILLETSPLSLKERTALKLVTKLGVGKRVRKLPAVQAQKLNREAREVR